MTDTHPAPTPAFPPPDHDRRAAIVLVHGAWVGEWSWAPILPALRASGRAVHAVSLTGQGSRRHQMSPNVTLSDHVADLVQVLEVHDLVDATIVAHSYGGRVVTRAWHDIAPRTARLVYLDAHAPVGPPPDLDDLVAGLAAPDAGMVPFSGFDLDAATAGGDAALAWFHDRLVPQSLATLTQPFHVELPAALPKTYVSAGAEPSTRFARYAAAVAASPDWDHRELPGTHWLMITHPAEVARIILDDDCDARPQEDPR